MMLRKKLLSTSLDFTFGEKKDGYLETYEVTDCHHDAQAFMKTQLMMGWDSKERFDKPEVEIEYIMGYVNK